MKHLLKAKIRYKYTIQRKRIQNAIYELKKQGYNITYQLPPYPKNVTLLDVHKLSKITRNYLRQEGN